MHTWVYRATPLKTDGDESTGGLLSVSVQVSDESMNTRFQDHRRAGRSCAPQIQPSPAADRDLAGEAASARPVAGSSLTADAAANSPRAAHAVDRGSSRISVSTRSVP